MSFKRGMWVTQIGPVKFSGDRSFIGSVMRIEGVHNHLIVVREYEDYDEMSRRWKRWTIDTNERPIEELSPEYVKGFFGECGLPEYVDNLAQKEAI